MLEIKGRPHAPSLHRMAESQFAPRCREHHSQPRRHPTGVSCVMRLHRLLTLNLSARHYQDEIRNLYPFPEAKVALGNVEVSFPRGNFGPSKIKSEIITQSGMRLRNGEEISVTKKRKFTICELQITYHFEFAFSRPRVGYT